MQYPYGPCTSINGRFRNPKLEVLVPTRSYQMFKARNIWPYMVQYLYFRILEFALSLWPIQFCIGYSLGPSGNCYALGPSARRGQGWSCLFAVRRRREFEACHINQVNVGISIINNPPKHHFYGWYKPSKMDGLLLLYPHDNHDSSWEWKLRERSEVTYCKVLRHAPRRLGSNCIHIQLCDSSSQKLCLFSGSAVSAIVSQWFGVVCPMAIPSLLFHYSFLNIEIWLRWEYSVLIIEKHYVKYDCLHLSGSRYSPFNNVHVLFDPQDPLTAPQLSYLHAEGTCPMIIPSADISVTIFYQKIVAWQTPFWHMWWSYVIHTSYMMIYDSIVINDIVMIYDDMIFIGIRESFANMLSRWACVSTMFYPCKLDETMYPLAITETCLLELFPFSSLTISYLNAHFFKRISRLAMLDYQGKEKEDETWLFRGWIHTCSIRYLQSFYMWGAFTPTYPLVSKHSYGKSPFWMGKLTINGHVP